MRVAFLRGTPDDVGKKLQEGGSVKEKGPAFALGKKNGKGNTEKRKKAVIKIA